MFYNFKIRTMRDNDVDPILAPLPYHSRSFDLSLCDQNSAIM